MDLSTFDNKGSARFVYVTCKDREEALKVGQSCVEARLAACANVLNGMESIYWWEGKLEVGQECVLIMKTLEKHVDALTELVKDHHSYQVPCVVSLPITGGNEDYLAWLASETR